MAFSDCHETHSSSSELLNIYILFYLYFSFANKIKEAMTNEIKLSKAAF